MGSRTKTARDRAQKGSVVRGDDDGGRRGGAHAASGFDRVMAALCGWLVAGFLPGVGADHNLPSTLETSSNPWHGIPYPGFATVAAFLVWSYFRGVAAGRARQGALPVGCGPSIVGCVGNVRC